MKAKIINLWDLISTGFWFVPLLLTVVSIVLSFLIPSLDKRVSPWLSDSFGWSSMNATTAQAILAAIAGAMVTVAGVVFSITMVSLSIASTQLGPRLLRTFMASSFTHVALGIFLGTSLYAFLVLSQVRSEEEDLFVPHFAVLVAVILAAGNLVFLIYYIHKTAVLMQAPNAVRQVALDLDQSIERIFPGELGEPPEVAAGAKDAEEIFRELGDDYKDVESDQDGYIQAFDLDSLESLTQKHDIVLELLYRPGHFIIRKASLAHVWPASSCSKEIVSAVNQACIVGNRPTPRQDVEAAVNELVEVAVRALSAAINDPFTAINCIDNLSASLSRMVTKPIPSRYRFDKSGRLRIVANAVTFPDVLNAATDQIRQYGSDSVSVSIRLLDSLNRVAQTAHRKADLMAITRQAQMILHASEQRQVEGADLDDVRKRYENLRKRIEEKTISPVP